jgi:hypothetical protein
MNDLFATEFNSADNVSWSIAECFHGLSHGTPVPVAASVHVERERVPSAKRLFVFAIR